MRRCQTLRALNATHSETAARRPAPREAHKILADCRDLCVRRLHEAFSDILAKLADTLMDRASRTDVRDEQQMFLDARGMLHGQKGTLLADFEKRVRKRIDDVVAGRSEDKPDFAAVTSGQLTLVETATMDETVIRGNLKRVIENVCYDELQQLSRGVGFLLDRPDLELDGNPFAPGVIVDAFADALKEIPTERRIKFQVLKELNQAQLSDINAIYADLNKHLVGLRIVPGAPRPINVGVERGRGDARRPYVPAASPAPPPVAEVDVMALFQRMFASGASFRAPGHAPAVPPAPSYGAAPQQPFGAAPQAPYGASPQPSYGAPPSPSYGAPDAGDLDFPAIQMPGAAMPPGGVPPSATRTFAPLPPTSSGYVPGAPIITSVDLHEGLTRLQAGQSGFEVGGAAVPFSGIPTGLHNVLRDLQESPLGQKANQLESMTIEMVAMLFDFIFETKDLPDGIKALLARLQIPVLKAAMLDGAFFAKKSHPARLLVNELAQAGLGWSPVMGQDDPLYRQIEKIVHAVLERFADDLALFEELRGDLQAFLAEEEQAAEQNIATTAEEINQRDRRDINV